MLLNERQRRARRLRHLADRVDDVLGAEGLAVVEGHAGAELDLPHRRVLVRSPLEREPGAGAQVGVQDARAGRYSSGSRLSSIGVTPRIGLSVSAVPRADIAETEGPAADGRAGAVVVLAVELPSAEPPPQAASSVRVRADAGRAPSGIVARDPLLARRRARRVCQDLGHRLLQIGRCPRSVRCHRRPDKATKCSLVPHARHRSAAVLPSRRLRRQHVAASRPSRRKRGGLP